MLHFFTTRMSALTLVVLLFVPAVSGAEIIDRVVAIVNDDIITLSEFNEEGGKLFAQIKKTAPPLEKKKILAQAEKEILSKLIENKILEQRAEKIGVIVSESEIDAAIENMLAERNTTRQTYLKELAKAGLTPEEHRKTLKTQILQSKLVSYEVRSKIVIPDQKLKDYYDNRYITADSPDGMHILQMGFTWGEKNSSSDTKQAAAKRAAQIRKMLSEGQDFKQLAASFSDLPSAKNGGDLGIIKKNELAAYMRDALENIPPGKISEVIETPAGFQFFMLLSYKEGDKIEIAPFEMLKSEINDKLYQEEMENRYNKWVKDLKEQAFIKELL